MYIDPPPRYETLRDFVVGPRTDEVRFCKCGHTLTQHKPLEGSNTTPCEVTSCICPSFQE